MESVRVSYFKKGKKLRNEKRLFWGERTTTSYFCFKRILHTPPLFYSLYSWLFESIKENKKDHPLSWRKWLGNDPHLVSLFHCFNAFLRSVFSQLTCLLPSSTFPYKSLCWLPALKQLHHPPHHRSLSFWLDYKLQKDKEAVCTLKAV